MRKNIISFVQGKLITMLFKLTPILLVSFLIFGNLAAVKLPLKRSLKVQKEETPKQLLGDPGQHYQWEVRQEPTATLPFNITALTNGIGSAGSSAILALASVPVLKGVAKASILALPFYVKEILIRPLVLVALLLFLLTGAAYFACNVINCQNLMGGLGDLGGSFGGSLPFGGISPLGRRNDEQVQLLYDKTLRPILKSIEYGYQKYK